MKTKFLLHSLQGNSFESFFPNDFKMKFFLHSLQKGLDLEFLFPKWHVDGILVSFTARKQLWSFLIHFWVFNEESVLMWSILLHKLKQKVLFSLSVWFCCSDHNVIKRTWSKTSLQFFNDNQSYATSCFDIRSILLNRV